MDKEQKQPSPFDLATAHVLERYAWYADRTVDMMPYSEVYKLVNCIIDEVTAAHLSTVANICADYTMMVLQDIEHAKHLISALEEAKSTIDLLTAHLKAANNTIEFEKRTRLELPRDANGNRIYPDSMLEQWGAIEDLRYSNGHWLVRGHDTQARGSDASAPWLPADKVVVRTEDREDAPEEASDQETHDAARPHGCKTRNDADHTVKAFCLGNLSPAELLDLLCPPDNGTSEEA